ncbi:glutathione transferase GstA [Zophobihabitans entericus]|uniref:Glutathione transferase GstA n=1 Tax=Zophobihabitans entericus TaxID=1635327 RepID=A0A6G9IDD5_9GAMM|nr:glutathione transferase GstA [Zophobihabitans entericus]QIQ22245.1 glutathione transferase GstA [Zophobihabitans entericus]
MKLYYSPGACSLSPHIVLCEAGLKFETQQVNLRTKELEGGGNFFEINPKGQVPTLQLDSGKILTEGAAIVQYIADLVPEKKLLAPVGEFERYQAIAWLNYVGTEIHKNYGPIFRGDSSEEAKLAACDVLAKKFEYVEEVLSKQDYLVNNQFTVADAYLFTTLRWRKYMPRVATYPATEKYMSRMQARASVTKAIAEEEGR